MSGLRMQAALRTALVALPFALLGGVGGCSHEAGVSAVEAVSGNTLPRPIGVSDPVTAASIPAEYFGVHLSEVGLSPWPIVPIGSRRNFGGTIYDPANTQYADPFQNVSWNAMNTAKDTYRWGTMDFLSGLLSQHGNLDNMFTFYIAGWGAPTPFFAVSADGQVDLQAWSDFVSAFANRYVGQTRYFEVFNEPNGSNAYPMSTYVSMARAAYKAIKAVDSNLLVVGPTVTWPSAPGETYPSCDESHLNLGDVWLDCFLTQGGAGTFDVFSFHGYWAYADRKPAAHFGEDVLIPLAQFKRVLNAHNLQGTPIWDTEASYLNSDPDPADRAAAIAKYYLLQWSEGVSRFYSFTYQDSIWTQSNLTSFHEAPPWNGIAVPATTVPSQLNAAGVAYTEVFKWMVGAEMTTSCSQDASTGTYTCGLSRPGGYYATAVWNSGGSPVSFPVPAGVTLVRKLDGTVEKLVSSTVSVGDVPILLESQATGTGSISEAGGAGNNGHIDEISDQTGQVRGWAYDEDDPSASVLVQLYLDGPAGAPGSSFIGAAMTEDLRTDVNSARQITGTHGFHFQLPPSYWDGQAHQLYAYSLLQSPGNQGVLFRINGSPSSFTLQSKSPYAGNIDAVTPDFDAANRNGELIRGWAWNSLQPDTPITVYFFLDGTPAQGGLYIGQAVAEQYRADLSTAGKGNGEHGFAFQLGNMTAVHNGVENFDPTIAHTIYAIPEDPSNPTLPHSGFSFTQVTP